MNSDRIFRPSISNIVLCLIFLFFGISFVVLTVGESIMRQDATIITGSIPQLLFFALFTFVIPGWILSIKVRLADDRMIFRSLFSRRVLLYSAISRINTRFVAVKGGRSRQVIFFDQNGKQTITLRGSNFNRRDLALVVKIAMSHNPGIDLEDEVGLLQDQINPVSG